MFYNNKINVIMAYPDELINKKYGKLTILSYYRKESKRNNLYVSCLCDCGHIKDYILTSVKFGNSKSCGCYNIGILLSQSGNKYNKEFFLTPSVERSYIIGLFAADACIESNGNRVSMSLQERDKDILYKINKLISDSNLVKFKNVKGDQNQNQYTFRINSQEIVNQLKLLGIQSRKSKTYVVPELFKNDPNFWRGLLDGDGYISIRSDRKSYLNIGICGTIDMCMCFRNFCTSISNSENKLTIESTVTNNNFARYKIGGSYAIKICDVLYNDIDNGLFISRKYENYKKVKNER